MDSAIELFERWKSRWSATLLEGYMFHLLSIDERFGGELVKLSQERIDEVNIKVPTIYAILKRSNDMGLLKVDYKESENGITRGTQRKYYTLTDEGRYYYKLLTKHMKESVSELFNAQKQIVEEN